MNHTIAIVQNKHNIPLIIIIIHTEPCGCLSWTHRYSGSEEDPHMFLKWAAFLCSISPRFTVASFSVCPRRSRHPTLWMGPSGTLLQQQVLSVEAVRYTWGSGTVKGPRTCRNELWKATVQGQKGHFLCLPHWLILCHICKPGEMTARCRCWRY